MKKLKTKSNAITLLASLLGVGATAQAQTLYSTANDFAQFAGGAAITSASTYSVSSTVNGMAILQIPGGQARSARYN